MNANALVPKFVLAPEHLPDSVVFRFLKQALASMSPASSPIKGGTASSPHVGSTVRWPVELPDVVKRDPTISSM